MNRRADGETPTVETAVVAEPTGSATNGASPGTATAPAGEAIGGGRGFLQTLLSWRELARTPYGLGPILILGFLFFVQIFESQAFNVAGPDVARDLHINLRQIIGVIQTVGLVTYFAALAAAWYLDRHPRARWVGIAALVGALANMASTRVHTEGALSATRAADAAASQTESIPLFALVADYYPIEARGRALVVISSFQRVASIAALVLVGFAVTTYGWRPVNFALGIPVLLLGVVAALRLREPIRGYFDRRAAGLSEEDARVEDEPQSFGETWRTTWSIRTLRRLFVSDLIASIGSNGFTVLFPFYLAEIYGLNAFERSLLSLPALLLGLLGGFIGGALLDRFSSRAPSNVLRLIAVFGLISVLPVVVASFHPPIAVLVVLFAVFAFGNAMTGPASFAIYSQIIPSNVRTLGLTITGLAQVPAILALGFFSSFVVQYGYEPVFQLCVPFLVVGAIVAISAADLFEIDRRNQLSASRAREQWKAAQEQGAERILVCRDVDVFYGGTQVLFGVDFEVEAGEVIALLGTNGAGKSTLLRAISGGQEASGGAIVFDGRDVTHMPPHEIAQRGVIYMPGGRGVFPALTVEENLNLAVWMYDDAAEAKQQMDEVRAMFPVLWERRSQPAGSLSGGEQQMLSLSQAFLSRPKLLMIDELSLGLSPQVVGELLQIVRRINEQGTTVIVVEQSVNVALNLAERAVFMEKGEVKFMGDTAELLRRPDILRSVYVKGTAGGGAVAQTEAARIRRQEELDRGGQVLGVVQVEKAFGGIKALDNVSFDLRQGEVLGIIGPNGSGKTTLFDIISGYQKPDGGKILFDGMDVTRMSAEERAARKLVRRFQDARLFPSLTVYEALLIALDQRLEVRSTLMGMAGLPPARRAEKRARVRADRLLELLDIESYRDKFVRELSTGLRRIVDLAFVLATEPKVLLLDEPSSGIAQAESENLAPLLRRIRYETGCSILIIEHDIPLITAVSDELIAMNLGQVVRRGPAREVLDDPVVVESYLGGSEAAVKRSGSLT